MEACISLPRPLKLTLEGADDNGGNYLSWSGDLGQKALADSGTVNFMDTFYGMRCNGRWTLFFADRVAGDQSKLMSWGMEVVPEPLNVALGVFGVLAGGASFGRWWSRRRAGILPA